MSFGRWTFTSTPPPREKTLKMLNVIDQSTREALAIDADRAINADGVVDVLECLAYRHGTPAYVWFDNGP